MNHFLLSFAAPAVPVLYYVTLRRLPFSWYSPPHAFIIAYSVTAFAGLGIYPALDPYELGVSAELTLHTDDIIAAAAGLLWAILSAQLGILVIARPRTVRTLMLHRSSPLPRLRPPWLLGCASVPLVLLALGSGPASLLERSEYIPLDVQLLKIAGSAFAPVALVALGYTHAVARRGVLKLLCAGLALCYVILFFALATRLFALAMLLYGLGLYAPTPRRKARAIFLLVGVIATPFLLSIPAVLRSLPIQGILPFLDAVANDPRLFREWTLLASLHNVIFSFPLTAYVMNAPPVPWELLWLSLDPRPGFMTDWYSLNDQVRVNAVTPYNTPGQLLNHGLGVTWCYYVTAGAYLTHLDLRVRRDIGAGLVAAPMVCIGLCMMFVLMSLQYNLRASTRFLYYAVAVEVLLTLWVPRGARRPTRAVAGHGRKTRSYTARQGLT